MAYAFFDLKFNSSCISYSSYNSISQIGSGSGTVKAGINQPGLLRIVVDYSSYAAAHTGYGASGTGYLCKINFNAINTGNCSLVFVEGQGTPAGELTLIRWAAYSQSKIENVSWTNISITVVK